VRRKPAPPPASGADAHVQVENRLRQAQEAVGWVDGIFGRSAQA